MPNTLLKPGKQNGKLAFKDPDFLMRDEMRSHRLALEFDKADLGMKDHGVNSTIVVFGSARTPAPDQVKTGSEGSGDPQNRYLMNPHWYVQARAFGRIVSERGGALTPANGKLENVICTGGGPGIMEAANRGAADAGAPTIGLNIQLPMEQDVNPYVSPELSFEFHYFGMRKMHFVMRANALAAFPGGFGTLDELFDVLTLIQTGKTPRIPVLLFCSDYWNRVVNFEVLAEMGMISPEDLSLFKIVDSADEGWEMLVEHGLQGPPHTGEV